jgi:hypothetical protein
MKNLLTLTLVSLAIAAPCATAKESGPQLMRVAAVTADNSPVFSFATDELWSYLRKGLTYLESPTPLLPPEAVQPSYVHPDGRGFGAYGFSPEAYEDVQRLYPYFKKYAWQQLLASQRLYDLANRALCDWMLKNLRPYFPVSAEKKEIFLVVHKAWNLGLGGFKLGREVVPSRTRRAEEFLAGNG